MRLAVQLYTLREFTHTEQDFASALRVCHGIGYEGVQLSAVSCMNGPEPLVSAARAREMLDANGLECVATHRQWRSLADSLDTEIQFHQTLRCAYAAVGSIESDFGRLPAAYPQFVEQAKPIIERLKSAGIQFGYHNHSHEFMRDPQTGKTGMDALIELGDPDVMMEIDTYWVLHAGYDPANMLARLAGRVPMIHVKDREVAEEGPVMAPVGEGLLDWDRILPAAQRAGTEWLIVEQDTCRRDPFDCLTSSFEFLKDRVS